MTKDMQKKTRILIKIFTSIFLYTVLYIVGYFIAQAVLNSQGLVYLNQFRYVSYAIMGLGVILGTLQWIVTGGKDKARPAVGIVLIIIEVFIAVGVYCVFSTFDNKEEIVEFDGITMVKETITLSYDSPKNYYDYQNIFVRKNAIICHDTCDK